MAKRNRAKQHRRENLFRTHQTVPLTNPLLLRTLGIKRTPPTQHKPYRSPPATHHSAFLPFPPPSCRLLRHSIASSAILGRWGLTALAPYLLQLAFSLLETRNQVGMPPLLLAAPTIWDPLRNVRKNSEIPRTKFSSSWRARRWFKGLSPKRSQPASSQYRPHDYFDSSDDGGLADRRRWSSEAPRAPRQ